MTKNKQKIEDEIIKLAKTKPVGLSNREIQQWLPGIEPQARAEAINKLLKKGILVLFKDGLNLLYKFKDPDSKAPTKDCDNEEKVVFAIIEEAGGKGIWIRDIRYKSNLMMTQLNKVLKSLEVKKLIKAVKSVSASKKKVYMLYDLEPDNSVTGGAWYQDQDFESEFVDVLNQQCCRFLEQKRVDALNNKHSSGPAAIKQMSSATPAQVHKFISDLGISKVQLSVQDLETILYTLVLDGKAERTMSADGEYSYCWVESLLPSSGLVKLTCGICPVVNRCADIGGINAKTCVYLGEWLDV